MSIASKNLFTLLGNDTDGSELPSAPVNTVDKNVMRSGKRDVEPLAPAKPAGTNVGARRNVGGNEGAYRDRNAGSAPNHRRATDEPSRGGPRGGRGARERGGRGGRFPRENDDRHSKGFPRGGTEKQAAQSWGATEGNAEQKDEQAGEEQAEKEFKDAAVEDAEVPETPVEPENTNKSYEEYLADLAEKKAALADAFETRQANEGNTKLDKKWANAKVLKADEEDFMPASSGKAKRERERKAKNVLAIDQSWVEIDRPTRGGRGGSRGDGGRGRGRGEGRGRGRGGEGRGFEGRGGRGGRDTTSAFNANKADFPDLGA